MTRADTAPPLLGVVLAGGESRRFGSPKALAVLEGEPLWKRAHARVAGAGLPVLVLANDPGVVAEVVGTAEVRADLRPGLGPLAGIETGLREAEARGIRGVLVFACDLTRVSGQMLVELVQSWPGQGGAAFSAPGPWGLSPVCSVWGVDLLPAVMAALDAGRASPGALLRSLPHVRIDIAEIDPEADPARVFRSANTPEDLAEIASEEPCR